jgi:hypothetical protein
VEFCRTIQFFAKYPDEENALTLNVRMEEVRTSITNLRLAAAECSRGISEHLSPLCNDVN